MPKDTTTATTEVVLRSGATALVTPDFAAHYPALAPDEAMLELLEENLGGQALTMGNLQIIKMPSGDSGTAFRVRKMGKDEYKSKLTGILVAWKPRRSMWVASDPDGSRPDCSSTDNKRPTPGGLYAPGGELAAQNPTGLCVNCPMAQFGSDDGGRGAKCREQRMLFLTPQGALFPVIVTAPRTSIKSLGAFMMDLLDQSTPYYGVEVELTLEPTSNKDNQKYNILHLEATRTLEAGEVAAARAYGGEVRAMIEASMNDFSRESVADYDDGGISVGGEPVA
jgi:hypothetical protein